MTSFVASFGYAQDEEGVAMVGLADHQFETRQFVLFQQSRSPSAQDVALGHSRLHVSIGRPEAGVYGGIESIELFAERLEVRFDAEGASALGVGPLLRVTFSVELEALPRIAEMLARIAPDKFVDRR